MGYLDKLRQGSFRGFKFFIETSQVSGGKRAVQHQYPNRETPYTEDLGRNARSYQIEGHVIGDNYMEAKDRLFEVFEKKGSGELIHPYYGSLTVQVSSLNVSESIKQGAIATFSVTFLEQGDAKFPKGVNDKGAILGIKTANALALAKKDFDDRFSITALPEFALKSARNLIKKVQKLFDDTTKPLSNAAEDIANLSFTTRNLVAETNALLKSPEKLSQRLLDSFQMMKDAIPGNKDKTKALKVFYKFEGDDKVKESTPTRKREAQNKKVFEDFIRRVSAISSGETAIVSEYESIEEAHQARQAITEVIEEQIQVLEVDQPNTELYQSMVDVNASIVESLPDPDADIPSIKKITPETDKISIVLAYDLNESLDNEQDIISRNKIRHPAFIPANKELEVISGS